MPKDALNKILQHKMEGFDVVPAGSSFNSQAAWQKLENRLPQQKKKYAWYYIAAAALLLLAVSTMYLLNGTERPGYAHTKTKQAVPASVAVPDKATTAHSKTNTVLPASNLSHTAGKKANTVSPATPSLPQQESIVIVYPPDEQNTATDSMATTPVATTSSASATNTATTTPARTIKVIHINDVSDDPSYRETEKKTRSNFSFSHPFKTEKTTGTSAPQKNRVVLPITIN